MIEPNLIQQRDTGLLFFTNQTLTRHSPHLTIHIYHGFVLELLVG